VFRYITRRGLPPPLQPFSSSLQAFFLGRPFFPPPPKSLFLNLFVIIPATFFWGLLLCFFSPFYVPVWSPLSTKRRFSRQALFLLIFGETSEFLFFQIYTCLIDSSLPSIVYAPSSFMGYFPFLFPSGFGYPFLLFFCLLSSLISPSRETPLPLKNVFSACR